MSSNRSNINDVIKTIIDFKPEKKRNAFVTFIVTMVSFFTSYIVVCKLL